MITAKEAFSISNIINTPKAQKVLEEINKLILTKAMDGEFSADITRVDYIPAVLTYLESVGYTVKTLKGDYSEPISVLVSWSSHKEPLDNERYEGNTQNLSE
jgi:hypothetical protein